MNYHYKAYLSKHWSLIATMVDDNYVDETNVNDFLVMGLNLYTPCLELKHSLGCTGKMIVYQLEPLVNNHWWKISEIINKLKDADEVWDYDLDNIELLKQHGIEAKFKPIVYTDKLQVVKYVPNPDIDILFYGSPTKYRTKFIEDFIGGYVFHSEEDVQIMRNLNIVNLFNIEGEQLDDFISRSKIILNLNPYDGITRQQQTRIFYPLINKKCILSQKSNRNYFGNCIVEFTDSQDFGSKAIELLKNDKWRDYPTFPNSSSSSKEYQDYLNFINRRPIISEPINTIQD